MPRAARGSSRLKPNRSDLTRPAPITTVPGQGYGEQAQQRAAQQVIPMGAQPVATGGGGAGAPPQTPSAAPAPQMPLPGVKPFTRPTERPNEPVTHGLPVGPGAGPEALTGVGAIARDNQVQQGTLINVLNNLASGPNATPAIRDLAARANTGAQ